MSNTTVIDARQMFRSTTRVGNDIISMESGGSGPALILLHGLAGSNRWWRRNMEYLTADFHVYAPDIRGFGRSRSFHAFDLNRAADELVQWMDALGIERAHVVGHSMGGYVAIDLAARFPDYVDRLVLVSAAVRATAANHRPDPAGKGMSPWRMLNMLPLVMPDLWQCKPRDVMAAVRTMMHTNIQQHLRRIIAPSLVIWGKHDPMVPIAQGYELAQQLPCEESVVIEEVGHHPMWEQPEAFNAELITFLHRPLREAPRTQRRLPRAA